MQRTHLTTGFGGEPTLIPSLGNIPLCTTPFSSTSPTRLVPAGTERGMGRCAYPEPELLPGSSEVPLPYLTLAAPPSNVEDCRDTDVCADTVC
jgi:hypothetical protein